METIITPPVLRGTAEEKLGDLRSYLVRLSQQLEYALSDTVAAEQAKSSHNTDFTSTGEKRSAFDGEAYSALKSLIIKTADEVRSEIDTITKELRSSYIAISDYGTYREEILTDVEETAASVTRSIDYMSELDDALRGISDDFDEYRVRTQGYIRQGIIDYDDGVPVIGIAIGRDLVSTGASDSVNGKVYEVIDTSKNMSVWTSDKLSFYVNGSEIAYFSNGALHTSNLFVSDTVNLGGKWEISTRGGLTLKRI